MSEVFPAAVGGGGNACVVKTAKDSTGRNLPRTAMMGTPSQITLGSYATVTLWPGSYYYVDQPITNAIAVGWIWGGMAHPVVFSLSEIGKEVNISLLNPQSADSRIPVTLWIDVSVQQNGTQFCLKLKNNSPSSTYFSYLLSMYVE